MFLAIHFPFFIELNTSVQLCFENNKICVLLLLLKIVYHLAVCIVFQCTIFIGMIVLSKVRHIQFKTVRQNMLNIHFLFTKHETYFALDPLVLRTLVGADSGEMLVPSISAMYLRNFTLDAKTHEEYCTKTDRWNFI